MVVCMLVIIDSILGFNMGTAHIKGASMHSSAIQRDLYASPPEYCQWKRVTTWNLLKVSIWNSRCGYSMHSSSGFMSNGESWDGHSGRGQ